MPFPFLSHTQMAASIHTSSWIAGSTHHHVVIGIIGIIGHLPPKVLRAACISAATRLRLLIGIIGHHFTGGSGACPRARNHFPHAGFSQQPPSRQLQVGLIFRFAQGSSDTSLWLAMLNGWTASLGRRLFRPEVLGAHTQHTTTTQSTIKVGGLFEAPTHHTIEVGTDLLLVRSVASAL